MTGRTAVIILTSGGIIFVKSDFAICTNGFKSSDKSGAISVTTSSISGVSISTISEITGNSASIRSATIGIKSFKVSNNVFANGSSAICARCLKICKRSVKSYVSSAHCVMVSPFSCSVAVNASMSSVPSRIAEDIVDAALVPKISAAIAVAFVSSFALTIASMYICKPSAAPIPSFASVVTPFFMAASTSVVLTPCFSNCPISVVASSNEYPISRSCGP